MCLKALTASDLDGYIGLFFNVRTPTYLQPLPSSECIPSTSCQEQRQHTGHMLAAGILAARMGLHDLDDGPCRSASLQNSNYKMWGLVKWWRMTMMPCVDQAFPAFAVSLPGKLTWFRRLGFRASGNLAYRVDLVIQAARSVRF